MFDEIYIDYCMIWRIPPDNFGFIPQAFADIMSGIMYFPVP
jgi:hypothetical protein